MALSDSRDGRALARLFREFDADLDRIRFAMAAESGPAENATPVDGEGSDSD